MDSGVVPERGWGEEGALTPEQTAVSVRRASGGGCGWLWLLCAQLRLRLWLRLRLRLRLRL